MRKKQIREEKQERQNKIESIFYYLLHHNKNYTKEQYNKIEELAELLNVNI